MHVSELWRYPIKSMQGERLDRCGMDDKGLVGDRRHGVTDTVTGMVLTARRSPQLLLGHPASGPNGEMAVLLPDGTTSADPAVLSAWLGRPARLDSAKPTRHSTYETPIDSEHEDAAWGRWEGPAGTFHDSTRTQISIVATGDLAHWDVRRFRPNVVVEAPSADVLLDRTLRIGDAVLTVVKQIDRCVIVTRPQPDGIDRDLEVLRTVARERSNLLGVGAMIEVSGSIKVGDTVELLD